MTNEGEKGERRFLDLDKISGEGKTLKEIIESGEEIPDELRESVQALVKTVSEMRAALLNAIQGLAASAAQMVDSYRAALKVGQIQELEKIRDEAKAIAEVPEEREWVAWVKAGLQNLSEANVTLRKVLEEQIEATVAAEKDRKEQRNRHMREMALVFGLAIVGWLKEWLFDVIERLLGG